jgi:hypothetical protein
MLLSLSTLKHQIDKFGIVVLHQDHKDLIIMKVKICGKMEMEKILTMYLLMIFKLLFDFSFSQFNINFSVEI